MANTSGTAGGVGSPQGGAQGWDAAVNIQPIPMSNAGTTAAGAAGSAITTALINAGAFANVVTALVNRTIIENLRTQPVFLADGNFIRARHVPGTNQLVYTYFADLSPAVVLLEGIPPETEKLNLGTMSIDGVQKGKTVAITDLADVFSPFDLYSVAAEKVAFNAIDTAEKDVATILAGAGGITLTPTGVGPVERVVEAVTALKIAEVPQYADGMYHAFISPADAAALMTQTGELGWTDTMKYAGNQQLLNGEIGRIRGVRFVETNRIGNGATIIHGPDYMVWGDYQSIQAYRVAPGGDHADPLAQRGLVGWKGMWGVKALTFAGATNAGPAANPTGWRYVKVDLTP